MALYNYECSKCKTFKKTFKKDPSCPNCKEIMTRSVNPPAMDIKETLDNGVMARAVTRFKDVEELMKERTKVDEQRRFEK